MLKVSCTIFAKSMTEYASVSRGVKAILLYYLFGEKKLSMKTRGTFKNAGNYTKRSAQY